MIKLIRIVAVSTLVTILAGCGVKFSKPSIFAWHGYKPKAPRLKFEYKIPEAGMWMHEHHARNINNRLYVPENMRMVRGERPYNFSQRFRELYIQESMQPAEFLNMLKMSDQLRCTQVDYNVVEIIKGGYLYEEKASACRQFPNTFRVFGKILMNKDGLINLQYQYLKERVTERQILQMLDVIRHAKLKRIVYKMKKQI